MAEQGYGDPAKLVERVSALEAKAQKPAPVLIPVLDALKEIKAAILSTATNNETGQLLRTILAAVDDLGTKEDRIMTLLEQIELKQADAAVKARAIVDELLSLRQQLKSIPAPAATEAQLQEILDKQAALVETLSALAPATPAD